MLKPSFIARRNSHVWNLYSAGMPLQTIKKKLGLRTIIVTTEKQVEKFFLKFNFEIQ